MSQDYALYGFTFRSALTLPAAAAGDAGEGGLVEMRFGPVAARAGERLWAEEEGRALVVDVPDVARFRIAHGREILVDAAPGVSERNLRTYLLGSAMGALLHQRGLLPLHANAVEIGGRAVAFSGKSGAGKSTLAAWFADRGHALLCDDVCAIAPGADGGPPIVYPGVQRLRLWEDALIYSGRSAESFERSFDGYDKYDVPAGAAAAARPLPLAACYMIERGEEGDGDAARGTDEAPPAIRRLSGAEAVEALAANSYRGRFVKTMGLTRAHLALCLKIAAAAPVHAAPRLWGRARFDAEAGRLAAHAEAIAKAAQFQHFK